MPAKKKIKIIIDTNLFISFLIGKRLVGLKQALVQSNVQLIFSEQNIEELITVTRKLKFRKYFDTNKVADLIDLIHTIGKIEKITREPEICRDPKDNFLLALADKGKADYLVTGDADLLILKKYKNTRIITMGKLEQLINKMSGI
jgi:uncharacterized protein